MGFILGVESANGVCGAARAQRRFALPHRPSSAAHAPCSVFELDLYRPHAGVLGSGAGVMWQSEAPLNPGP